MGKIFLLLLKLGKENRVRFGVKRHIFLTEEVDCDSASLYTKTVY